MGIWLWLWLWLQNRKGPHMWCVISPSSRCPSCTVTAGWAPGMGGLISRLSIRSLLAVLEMGGNTIPLQFDFKPHRSISWTPFSGSSFYHSFSPSFNSLFCFLFLTLYQSLSLCSVLNCNCDFILFRAACLWRFVIKSKWTEVTSSDWECHNDISFLFPGWSVVGVTCYCDC